MHIVTKGPVAHLQGDLTHDGVTHAIIRSLAGSLQQIASEGMKIMHIDCSKLRTTDSRGLQLLYVWMQCARFRGVEPELINLPERLQLTLRNLGPGHCFTETILAG